MYFEMNFVEHERELEQSSEYSTIWFFKSQVFSYLCICNTQNFERVSIEIFVYVDFRVFCPIELSKCRTNIYINTFAL